MLPAGVKSTAGGIRNDDAPYSKVDRPRKRGDADVPPLSIRLGGLGGASVK